MNRPAFFSFFPILVLGFGSFSSPLVAQPGGPEPGAAYFDDMWGTVQDGVNLSSMTDISNVGQCPGNNANTANCWNYYSTATRVSWGSGTCNPYNSSQIAAYGYNGSANATYSHDAKSGDMFCFTTDHEVTVNWNNYYYQYYYNVQDDVIHETGSGGVGPLAILRSVPNSISDCWAFALAIALPDRRRTIERL